MPVVSQKKRTVVVPEAQARQCLAGSDEVLAGFDIVAGIDRARQSADVFLVVSASTLSKYFPVIAKATTHFRKWLRVLFIKQDIETNALIDKICSTELAKIKHKIFVFQDLAQVHRILRAWSLGDEHRNIASAWTDDGKNLIALDCALDRYELGFDEVRVLSKIPNSDRSKLVVHPFGYHLEWPDYDVQFDMLETYKCLRDSDYLAKKRLKALASHKEYGKAVRELRLKHGLTQQQIEYVAKISEKTIGRIERGEASATLKTIEKLAFAHGMSANDYMNEIARMIQSLRSSRSA